MSKPLRIGFVLLALALLVSGAWIGLAWAPPDREMGHVQRIMYMHVPAAWMALLAATMNFGTCVSYLWKASWKKDAFAEATAEVGLLFGTIAILLGAIWGRPTWGVYWAWDPRLTTMAILLVAYAGYLALRRFVDDPDRRAVWSAVVGIIIAVDVPVVYFSVKWWKSLHQVQSTPKTVDPQMVIALRWNAFAFLAVLIVFLVARYHIALASRIRETSVPDAPAGARQAVVS